MGLVGIGVACAGQCVDDAMHISQAEPGYGLDAFQGAVVLASGPRHENDGGELAGDRRVKARGYLQIMLHLLGLNGALRGGKQHADAEHNNIAAGKSDERVNGILYQFRLNELRNE